MEFTGRCAHGQAIGVYIVWRIMLLWKLIIINNNDKHIFRYQKHLSVFPTGVNMKFILLACASSELLHAQEKETAEYPVFELSILRNFHSQAILLGFYS